MRIAVILGTFFIIWVALLFAVIENAYPHSAPTGWAYDAACCNTRDCRQADGPNDPRTHGTQVLEIQGGYRVIGEGGKTLGDVEWNSKKVRPSKDEFYHVCTHGGLDTGGVICIYVPDRGY